MVLKSGDQRVEIDIPSDVTFADLGDITSIISTFSGFSEAFEDAQNHAIETAIELGLGQIQYQHQDKLNTRFMPKMASLMSPVGGTISNYAAISPATTLFT